MTLRNFGSRSAVSAGSALLITLTMVLLISIVILVFVTQVSLERQLSSVNLASQQASMIAQTGFDAALEQLRTEFTPYDDPFNTNTARPTTFWSLSPGRMDHFDLASSATGRPRLNRSVTLHSGFDSATPTNELADLNAKDSMGQRPIWHEDRPMPVQWKPVLESPGQPAASDNVIVGRYAYWVDDEGAKVNVNTADGSDNYTLSSYGQGTPTAVSLSVFDELADIEQVRQIAASARNQPFREVSELSNRAELVDAGDNVSAEFVAANQFNLTTYNRSPDFNIFNFPRFQLIPSNVGSLPTLAGVSNFTVVNLMIHYGRHGGFYGDDLSNSSSGASSTVRSLYPTPQQLSGTWTNAVWPLMPAYPFPSNTYGSLDKTTSYSLIGSDSKRVQTSLVKPNVGSVPGLQTGRFAAMVQMERYLTGVSTNTVDGVLKPYADPNKSPTDPLGNPIQWPFEAATYAAKYNLRQLDSITLQIFEMPRTDFMFRTNLIPYQTDSVSPGIAPYGILGDDIVQSAVGRYPRLTRVVAQIDVAQNSPVDLNADGTLDYNGAMLYPQYGFSFYVPRHLYEPSNVVDGRFIDTGAQWNHTQQAPFGWRTDWNQFYAYGNSKTSTLNDMDQVIPGQTVGSHLNPNSAWMDTLMYAEVWNPVIGDFMPGNSSGIDFWGNRRGMLDPDSRAQDMRYPSASLAGPEGTGNSVTYTAPLWVRDIYGANPQGAGRYAEMGVLVNFAKTDRFANGAGFKTRNIDGTNSPAIFGSRIEKLRLKGGITLRMNRNAITLGVTPIESFLGPMTPNASWITGHTPLTNAVVPIFWETAATNEGLAIDVSATPNNRTSKFAVAKVRDPLVNQLPGDWAVRHFDTAAAARAANGNNPNLFANWPSHGGNSTNNIAEVHNRNYDPEWVDMAADVAFLGQHPGPGGDEVWNPYWDNGQQRIGVVNASVGRFSLNTARQRSFPSVGQLQYLRTGAMPDNVDAKIGDADYAGMPFRCLNFGPENTQGNIPDWAMLDLYMVPNAIWTKPSSRFAYPQISANETNRPTLLHLTYGGASNGKINLNGSVIWPWAENDANYIRPMPLAAMFKGLRYNTNGIVTRTLGGAGRRTVTTDPSSWGVMSTQRAQTLAGDIAAHIRQNGPLAMPGQMCDITAVNDLGAKIPTTNSAGISLLPKHANGSIRLFSGDHFYTAGVQSGGVNQTRNDIVNQTIGNLTTQGNVFSVWVVAQSIKKLPTASGNYDVVESNSEIVGETRMRFIVERMLDPGVDGIYGNSLPKTTPVNTVGPSGHDQTIGTPDDLSHPDYHPPNPKFVYRVLSMEEIK